MQYNCVLDIYSCNKVPGEPSITWTRYGTTFGHYNQLHYIVPVAWDPDTFLIMTALDWLALDVCNGNLTRATPTCVSSQLYKSIPGPSGTCYINPQPMCTNDVLGNPGNNANCDAYAKVTLQQPTGATYQQWTYASQSLCEEKFHFLLIHLCITLFL